MDVAIGSAVYCRDGQVGTVEREETMLANGRERLLWHDLPLPRGLRQALREHEPVSHTLSVEMVEGPRRDAGIRPLWTNVPASSYQRSLGLSSC